VLKNNLKTMTVMVVSLLTLTACMMDPGGNGGSKPPQGKDWFGNPLPTADPVCEINGGAQPDVPENPDPNMKSAVIKVQVNITGSKAHKFGGMDQMCLPVALHVYGTADGENALKIEDGQQLPWNGVRTTPWDASFIVVYDSSKRGAPVVNIDLIATYTPEAGMNVTDFSKAGIVQMDCSVYINGRSRKSFLVPESRTTLTPDKSGTVHCQVSITV